MFDHTKKKSIMIGLFTSFILMCVLLIFIRHLDRDVFRILADTKPSLLLMLLVCSCLYILLDSLLYQAVFRDKAPSFTLSNAIALTGLRIFGKTAFPAGGAMPLQSYYLYKKGINPGQYVGITAALYVIQKTSVLLYAAGLILVEWKWVCRAAPGARKFLYFSAGICSVVIFVLFLLCTSKKVCHLAFWLIGKLPSNGKWSLRKEKWHSQIEALYRETHAIFRTRRKLLSILLLNFLKLFARFCIPFAAIKMMGTAPYTLLQAQTLAALMLLIANALPSVAGMGAVEFSFMLVFSESLGMYTAAAMLYYRCATYYFPFVLSVFLVLLIQKRLTGANTGPGFVRCSGHLLHRE